MQDLFSCKQLGQFVNNFLCLFSIIIILYEETNIAFAKFANIRKY